MRKWYLSALIGKFSFVIAVTFYLSAVQAQSTTLTTLPNPPYNGASSLTSPSQVSFVLGNSNAFAIRVTGISTWCTNVENNSVWQLYYSASSLSGTTTNMTIAPWTLAATSGITPVTATGITALNFTGLSVIVPAATQYRFALRNTGPGNVRYSTAGTPNIFTGGGVSLLLGNAQVAAANVGYSGTGTNLNLTPRYFTGAVTFEPDAACTNPPVAGTATSSTATACLGVPFTLNISGGTGGSGQTYQWQSSTDNISFTNIPGGTTASFTTSQTSSNYYRLVVTCGVSANSQSVFVATPNAVSGTFTINSALPTGGTNFQTFNAAYDYIKCGINGPVIFNVDAASGPYNEQLIMTAVPGASAVNTVTFNGNGRTLSFLSTNTNERAVIKLNGADHIRFNNLVIAPTGTSATEFGFGVHLINDADSNSITNCTININNSSTSTQYAGIVISSSHTSATTTGSALCDGNNFMGNTINGGYYGITMVGSGSDANRFNRVVRNRIQDFHNYGIYINGAFSAEIDSNIISRPTRITVAAFNGIYFTGLSNRTIVTKNTVTNPFGGSSGSTLAAYGIYLNGVDPLASNENIVSNNLIYNFTGTGEVIGLYNTSSDNVWYFHNTISIDGTGGAAISRGFYQNTLASGVVLLNNIFSITRGGAGAKYGLYFNTVASDISSNRNVLFINAAGGNDFTGFFGSAQQTLLNWQTASGDDANSLPSNPLFTDVSNGNYKPTSASIDNQGMPLGITNDIVNVIRSATTPDVGAYEFTPGNCAAPPIPGTALVSTSPVCVNTQVSLSVTGNSIGLGQTYQWQTSVAATGPFTNIGNVLSNPDTVITSSTTLYYRLASTCGIGTSFSIPVLLIVNPALAAGTYTINQLQPPSATNFVSFNAAKLAMQCGVAGPIVFDVVSNSGPYIEQLILDSIAGTSAINTVTFNGNGNTISYSAIDGNERAVIKLRRTDHIRFDSLTIEAGIAGTFGFGVHLINNADSNRFTRCNLVIPAIATNTNFAGMVISGSDASATGVGNTACDGNVFANNRISGGFYGITIAASATTPVFNNSITGNIITDYYSIGINLSGTTGTLVELNDISRPGRTVVTTCYGVFAQGVHNSLKISKNRVHNPFDGDLLNAAAFYGIYLTGVDAQSTTPTTVENNLVYKNTGDGPHYGLYNTSSNNVNYYHNTIALDHSLNPTTNSSFAFYQTTAADGINLRNNVLSVTRAGSGDKYGEFWNTSTSVITSNFNDFHITGSNAAVGFNNGTDRITLADWQTATTQDANSVAINPAFGGAATGNYKPLAPQLDNKGTAVGITTDILGDPRSATTPDIGAYEFVVPPCVDPPSASNNTTANPSSNICIETNVALSLPGYIIGAGHTFQWQFASAAAGPYTNLGTPLPFPDTVILSTTTLYYRVEIRCNSGTAVYSTPVLVTVNPPFAAGTYTINSALPPSATNFTSFNAAVAALECGIDGHVFFDVAPNTYSEQVRMHRIRGASDNARVTFRSANGNPASVTLTYDATIAAANYVLKLDSASYVTYKNMTVSGINATNGRVIELANTASKDSLLNLVINAQTSTSTSNVIAGIYADNLRGDSNVIKGNSIIGGSSGIYFEGTSAANMTWDNVIDSNIVTRNFTYGIYTGFNGRIRVTKNEVTVESPRAGNSYGIYATSCDSLFQYTGNMVDMNGNTTTVYGMYFTNCDGNATQRAIIANNKITALSDNQANLYGLYQTNSTFNNTVNNVVSVNSEGTSVYGSYLTGTSNINFYNNTVLNNSTNVATTVAAYVNGGSVGNNSVRNNIFAHLGGGRAYYVANLGNLYSDYNTLYSTGPVLVQSSATVTYATLTAWMNTAYWDLNSISIRPALIGPADPRPKLDEPDVWAIHGRGTQIVGNDYDFNNSPRPTTLTTGVPDMGAYEFLPTVDPTVLTGVPALPAAGTTQVFTYGTDTVARVSWDATAPVPASFTLKRFSGVLPTGLTTGQNSMYYYVKADVPAQGAYKYKMNLGYIEPWQGFVSAENKIRMGRTNASNIWQVIGGSTLDAALNIIKDSVATHVDRYTGLEGDPSIVPTVPYLTVIDTSNKGTRFWVPYGHHYSMNQGNNGQDMWLYLATGADSANVTVRVNGTNWSRTYGIPANTARVSDIMPKFGMIDARTTDEGLFKRGISITSDKGIVAYAHIYDGATSGATMLLPVGVYGYEYRSLNMTQYYSSLSFSWFAVMTDRDSTLVEITPAVTTKGGRPAGVPFTVYLNRGEIYNVMGTTIGAAGTDLTGSAIRSIANARGECYPIALFSGSSRTAICNTSNGDNLIQQVFPSQAWGQKYLTFATANSNSNTNYNSNIYRVMVKDPTTVVSVNGTPLNPATLATPGNYYQFSTTQGNGPNGAVYVQADKPVMMAQYMVSTSAFQCPGVTASGTGDPEMIYISPIEQGIDSAVFYNTNESSITSNYINVVLPTAGLASLRIDGISTFTDVFAHPYLAGYSCVRHNLGSAASQHRITSDSTFTAITYGLGSVESYGYNAGTLVKNLNALATFSNTLGTVQTDYTCVNAPVKFNLSITVKPTVLTWQFSAVPSLVTNTDIIQTNPVASDSALIGTKWYFTYTVTTNYYFSDTGTFYIPIKVTHPSIEGCSSTQEITLPINVRPAPVATFVTDQVICLGENSLFNSTASSSSGEPINTWNWNFGDNSSSTLQNPAHTYTAPGIYNVTLQVLAADGCLADTVKTVTVDALPSVLLVADSLVVCGNSGAVFNVQSPQAGVVYEWFDVPTGGTALASGNSYTTPPVLGQAVYYVQGTSANGCIGARTRMFVNLLPDVPVPVVRVDNVGVDFVDFSWNAVANALTYEVSTDNGVNWLTPSSGATGLTHTVTGLSPNQDVSLIVRAKGGASCQQATSAPATAKTLIDQIYIPNAFSPNGDGKNEVLMVYGYIIKSMRMVIYNQWGEKVFESNNQAVGWNGMYKGKMQPSGVYMYVCQMTLKDNSTLLKKGSINLVR